MSALTWKRYGSGCNRTPKQDSLRKGGLRQRDIKYPALDIRPFLSELFGVEREIRLDGGEITILKTLGLSGTSMNGKMLEERAGMEKAEFIETLTGLIELGYVDSSKVNITNMDDVERSTFRVNSSYSKDLRDALHPNRKREERGRRQRRR